MAEPALSQLYGESRSRLLALVSGLDERGLAAPVPACPGWRVRDVVAHLTAVGEDVLEGRLTGPPTEEQSAAQVARFGGRPFPEVVEDRAYDLGPDGEAAIVLTTDRFAAFRWSMGRRSRRQLADLDWTGDPSPVLDHLFVFGPVATDIDE